MFNRLNKVVYAVTLVLILGMPSLSRAESYVAGQLGITIPHSLSNGEVADTSGATSITPGSTITSLQLNKSAVYGAKLGHYFEGTPWLKDVFGGKSWLGVETEIFNTTPDIKEQSFTINTPTGSFPATFVREDFRVLTWAFNLVARYPGKRFQPYAGIGLGLFFGHISNDAIPDSRSSTKPGLNTQLGLRYLMSDKLSVFGEWKFNHTRFNFEETSDVTSLNVTYNAHHLMFGLAYHF